GDADAAVAPVGANIGIAVDGAPRPVVVIGVIEPPIVGDFPAPHLLADAERAAGGAGRNPALEALAEIAPSARRRDRQDMRKLSVVIFVEPLSLETHHDPIFG